MRSKSNQFFHYQGAAYRILLRILKQEVKNTWDFMFVDIGSGMGRAVFVAEFCGYSNLLGIELNNQLVAIANHNLEIYSLKKSTTSIQFVNENALEYNYCDKPCVYFLFNPFNADVLNNVLQRIQKQSKSEALFIYMNPLYAKVFEQKGFKKVRTYKSGFYTEAIIYKLPAILK